MRIFLTLALMLIVAPLFGQTIEVSPKNKGEYVGVVRSDIPGGWAIMSFSPTSGFVAIQPEVLEGGKVAIVTAPAGNYAVMFFQKDSVQPMITNLVLGENKPQPVPPPEPQPTPDDGDAPFEAPGFSVLILKESQDTQYPVEQRNIFTDKDVIKYLYDKCVDLSDGYPAFRVWDDDYTEDQFSEAPELLKTAYYEVLKQSNAKLPWIAISTGKTGYTGPLPATVDETLELLKKYGG